MSLDLKRRENESVKDFKIRICRDRQLLGLTWEDVKDIINKETGDSFGESVYRKWYTAFKDGYDYVLNNNISSNEELTELELKKIEILEATKRQQSVNVEYNRISREKARRDLMIENVKESFEKLPVPEFNPPVLKQSSEKAGMLSFGDIHFGKKFKSLNNEYSEEIAKSRMEQLISEAKALVEREGLTKLHVVNGADSVEGMSLRVSQLTALQSGFIDQTINFSKFIASWLNELSKHVEVVYHHVPSANHSEIRPHGSSRGEFPAEDLEKIIMHYVHDVLELNNRVEVPLYERGVIDFEILGFNFAACHGHQLKGAKNAVKDLSMLHRKFYDYLLVYHFHHGNALTVGQSDTNNIEVLQCDSIMGSDEYSDSLMTGAKPGAKFYIFEKGKGKTITYNILL
jgi:hypothetical protein